MLAADVSTTLYNHSIINTFDCSRRDNDLLAWVDLPAEEGRVSLGQSISKTCAALVMTVNERVKSQEEVPPEDKHLTANTDCNRHDLECPWPDL